MRTIRSRVHRSTNVCLPGSDRRIKVNFDAAGLAEVEEEIYNFLMSCRRQLPGGGYDFEHPDGEGTIVLSNAPKSESPSPPADKGKDADDGDGSGDVNVDKTSEDKSPEKNVQPEKKEPQSMATDSSDGRCQAINKNGERCKRAALPGSPFCAMHQP